MSTKRKRFSKVDVLIDYLEVKRSAEIMFDKGQITASLCRDLIKREAVIAFQKITLMKQPTHI